MAEFSYLRISTINILDCFESPQKKNDECAFMVSRLEGQDGGNLKLSTVGFDREMDFKARFSPQDTQLTDLKALLTRYIELSRILYFKVPKSVQQSKAAVNFENIVTFFANHLVLGNQRHMNYKLVEGSSQKSFKSSEDLKNFMTNWKSYFEENSKAKMPDFKSLLSDSRLNPEEQQRLKEVLTMLDLNILAWDFVKAMKDEFKAKWENDPKLKREIELELLGALALLVDTIYWADIRSEAELRARLTSVDLTSTAMIYHKVFKKEISDQNLPSFHQLMKQVALAILASPLLQDAAKDDAFLKMRMKKVPEFLEDLVKLRIDHYFSFSQEEAFHASFVEALKHLLEKNNHYLKLCESFTQALKVRERSNETFYFDLDLELFNAQVRICYENLTSHDEKKAFLDALDFLYNEVVLGKSSHAIFVLSGREFIQYDAVSMLQSNGGIVADIKNWSDEKRELLRRDESLLRRKQLDQQSALGIYEYFGIGEAGLALGLASWTLIDHFENDKAAQTWQIASMSSLGGSILAYSICKPSGVDDDWIWACKLGGAVLGGLMGGLLYDRFGPGGSSQPNLIINPGGSYPGVENDRMNHIFHGGY